MRYSLGLMVSYKIPPQTNLEVLYAKELMLNLTPTVTFVDPLQFVLAQHNLPDYMEIDPKRCFMRSQPELTLTTQFP